LSHAVEDIEKRVRQDMHPSCQYNEVRSTIDDPSSDLGVVMLAGRAGVLIQEGLESADGGGDRWGMVECADEAVGV